MSYVAATSPSAFTTFGDLLRYLRRRARLHQRDLAIAVGYSESQICRLEQNQRLPELTALLAQFVPALGLDDEPDLAARLLELATAARGASPAERNLATTPARAPLPDNLPAPLTAMINRTADIAAVHALLERADVRLLTLIGPPGIGKTRLSIHAATALREQFPDGVLFVALAPIRDPALVLPAVARTLGIKEAGDQTLADALRAALRDRRILVILDNFEQVVDAAPHVADLLRMAPGLKALVTSRAALHVLGEHLFAVPPLELPDSHPASTRLPPLEELERYPAVELFVTRVRAIRPGFALTNDNASAVVAICACLDGLPLAIELAAARSRLFSPQALLERLCGAYGPTALQFLVDGPRDLLAHQRTLRSTIDWSYDLLGEDERRLLMWLAVFAGGWTAEAAEAVVSECRMKNEEWRNDQASFSILHSSFSIFDGLNSLLDQSLIRQEIGADGENRFTMLETIREYAREKLEASGQTGIARRRHAAHYLAQAQAAERQPGGAERERLLQRLEAEYDNLRVALEWCAVADTTAGLQLAASLQSFWHTHGYLNEGRSWLETLLARPDDGVAQPDVRARALCAAGFLAYHQGDLTRAAVCSEESLALFRALGERHGVAGALFNLGGVAYLRNDYAQAAVHYNDCLAIERDLGNRAEVAQALKNLGLIAKDRGDFARAAAYYEESLGLRRAIGDRRGVAQALFNLGVVAYWQGDFARATALTEQSLACYRELGDKMGIAYTIETLGMALYKCGDHAQATRLLEEGLRLFRELGDQVGVALLLNDLGLVAHTQGESELAVQLQREGLALAWTIGDKRRAAFCFEGLAMALAQRQALRAARLFGAAEALRAAIGSPLPPAERADYNHAVATARGNATPAEYQTAFAAAWRDGRQAPAEQTLAYALSDIGAD
jgi:predicted ATPase/Tfp pilus assembly protein PilF/DNA-binding XRE family transcriptional regulator